MLEGVTVLNTFVISSAIGSGTFILMIAVCLFLGLIAGLAVWDGKVVPAIISSLLCTALGVVVIVATSVNEEDVVRYEVTVSEEVNLTDFTERYKIIEQRGDIYVIEERTEETE